MRPEPSSNRPVAVWTVASTCIVLLMIGWYAACASSSATWSGATVFRSPAVSTLAPDPDPRVGLRPGRVDSLRRIIEPAAETSWNLQLVTNMPTPERFVGVTNSDLGFTGNYAIQGNYNGVLVWDITNPRQPTLKKDYLCPASQSDVSVYKYLLFVSAESGSARLDCGNEGVQDSVSHDRIRGIRIFDATDITDPKYIANVQTCRGSHTHTVVSDPNDPAHVYVYVSGNARVRSPTEVPGCSDLAPEEDPNSTHFRIEVIRVPLANPAAASVVSKPGILENLGAAPRSLARQADLAEAAAAAARGGGGGRAGEGRGGGRGGRGEEVRRVPLPPGPTQCHDITVYPAIGRAGGACGGFGILLDISDVANPRRIDQVADANMSFWHSATFSNDGSKVLFTDEWGGGGSPKCRPTDKYEWGANALFTLENNKMTFKSYYKLPAAQTTLENCVAHNGSLIPIPGRDVMVQGWYQGGISVFDWTDVSNPVEIAFFDRGPLDANRMYSAGSWSVYWYNGYIYSSEIARGLDVFDLMPSPFLSRNEIEAAKTVRFEQLNAQEQPKLVWPPSFALARAYLDQLERSKGLASDRIAAVRNELTRAEGLSGQQRRDALSQLATQLNGDAQAASDAAKVRTLATAVADLAQVQP